MNTIVTVNPSTPNLNKQQKQTAKELIAAKVQALIEQLGKGHSEAFTAYLTAMGRFHNYSFWQHSGDCTAESSDMQLYLAGVNEHAVLRIVGSKRWSVAYFLRTIQYLFE